MLISFGNAWASGASLKCTEAQVPSSLLAIMKSTTVQTLGELRMREIDGWAISWWSPAASIARGESDTG